MCRAYYISRYSSRELDRGRERAQLYHTHSIRTKNKHNRKWLIIVCLLFTLFVLSLFFPSFFLSFSCILFFFICFLLTDLPLKNFNFTEKFISSSMLLLCFIFSVGTNSCRSMHLSHPNMYRVQSQCCASFQESPHFAVNFNDSMRSF